MNKKEKWMLYVLIFAVLFVVATVAYRRLSDDFLSEGGETVENTEEKSFAPDFTIQDREGNMVKLSDFRGKPVVLNFWASWCGPCKSEMPAFQKVYETHGDAIHFIMVNLTDGSQETVESASQFITDNGYSFPVYFDVKLEGANAYLVYSVPRTYFIDADGYLVDGVYGAVNEEYLMSEIETL